MALKERNRSALYQGLITVVDEEAVQEMLSYFPARDVEEPVTKENLRAEMADLRSELKGELADLRMELKGEMADLRMELKGEMADLRAEFKGELADFRTEVRDDLTALELRLGDRMDDRFRTAFALTIGTNVATVAAVAMVIFAALRL